MLRKFSFPTPSSRVTAGCNSVASCPTFLLRLLPFSIQKKQNISSSSSSSFLKPTRPALFINPTEFGSTLEHNNGINVFDDDSHTNTSSNTSSSSSSFSKSTHVIATIGPASANEESIKRMIEHGMNICRLNFSHGSHEYHKANIEMIRRVVDTHFKDKQCHVAIALDTKGPEIRLGSFAPNSNNSNTTTTTAAQNETSISAATSSSVHHFEVGHKLKVTNDPTFRDKMSKDLLYIDYANLIPTTTTTATASSMKQPQRHHQQQQQVTRILIADGVLELRVLSIENNNNNTSSSSCPSRFLQCEVVSEAAIGSKSNVNLPGIVTDLPAISEKDMQDLEFAAKMKIDMIFASFTRSAFHIKMIGELLRSNNSKAAIVAKIENHEGVENINEILSENFCSGVMCARGDLGVEIPAERVFLAQKKIVAACNLIGKPAVVATQMLESMVKNPRPTRAEIADVANAVLDGCDVTMLSGETAKGDHPVKAVETLKRIGQTAFNYFQHQKYLAQMISHNQSTSPISSTAAAAVLLSHQNKAKCIITVTRSGQSVHDLRKYSPIAPIVAVCVDAERARKLNLVRGVIPLVFDDIPYSHFDEQISRAITFFTETPELSSWIGLKLKKGDLIVISCTDSYYNHRENNNNHNENENEDNTSNDDDETSRGGDQLSQTGYETFVKIIRV